MLETNNETEQVTVSNAVTTQHLRKKRKLEPAQNLPKPTSPATPQQCVLQEVYNKQNWCNPPIFSQSQNLHTRKPSSLSLISHDQSTMAAVRLPIPGFDQLHNEEYIILASTISLQLGHPIDDVNLDGVDYHCAAERHHRNYPFDGEPRAKRLKNEVLGQTMYAALATACNKRNRSTLTSTDIAFIDVSLQNFRAAEGLKNKIVDLTGTDDDSPRRNTTGRTTQRLTAITPNSVPTATRTTTD
jgi:hypothetical protein